VRRVHAFAQFVCAHKTAVSYSLENAVVIKKKPKAILNINNRVAYLIGHKIREQRFLVSAHIVPVLVIIIFKHFTRAVKITQAPRYCFSKLFLRGCVRGKELRRFISSFSVGNIAVSNSIEYIGVEAFEGCDNLETVILGDGITFIDSRAFRLLSDEF
jgi:hypothetical protein